MPLTLTYIRSKYGSVHLRPAAPKVSEQDVKSEKAASAPWGGGRRHEMVRGSLHGPLIFTEH